MTIAIDVAEMRVLQKNLSEAATGVSTAAPTMPGSSAFGQATLAGAADTFAASMRTAAKSLSENWSTLDKNVGATADDMSRTEDQILLLVKKLTAGLA